MSQDRSDSKTFISLLDNYHTDYGSFPEKLCADSGYGSLDHYRYMAAEGIENYVKPQIWQKMVRGEYIALCSFDEERNLICLSGGKAVKFDTCGTHSRGKGTKFHHIENCNGGNFKPYCMRCVADKKRQE